MTDDISRDEAEDIVYTSYEFPTDIKGKYLYIYGLLQSLFLQQDAANGISTALLGKKIDFKQEYPRALQDKIDQVSADITEKKQVEEETKQQLQEEIEANKQRISKIDAEFRKPRGRIATKEKSIAIKDAVIDGKFAITPEQFVDYMRDVIPKPYYLEPALKIVGTHMGNRLGLEKQYQIGIHDSSVKRSDGNDNTGCVIFIQADSPTDKIQSISLEGSQDLTDETAQMWCNLHLKILFSSLFVHSYLANGHGFACPVTAG